MKIPKIKKLVISMGCASIFTDKKKIDDIIFDLANISGQKPIFLKLKKSISTFKVRKGNYVGMKITLRSILMYNFMDKLINIIFPKLKNFKGFSETSFDNFNNFNFGLKDYSEFLEVDDFDFSEMRGFNVNIVINSKNRVESLFLLKSFNFPFNF